MKPLLRKLTQAVGRSGVFGINPADTFEIARVAFQYRRKIAIVLAIVDHLNENRPRDAVRLHQAKQGLRGRIFRWWMRSVSKGKRRIVLPNMNV